MQMMVHELTTQFWCQKTYVVMNASIFPCCVYFVILLTYLEIWTHCVNFCCLQQPALAVFILLYTHTRVRDRANIPPPYYILPLEISSVWCSFQHTPVHSTVQMYALIASFQFSEHILHHLSLTLTGLCFVCFITRLTTVFVTYSLSFHFISIAHMCVVLYCIHLLG